MSGPASVLGVRPPLSPIEPALSPWVLRVVRSLLPLWFRWRVGIQYCEVRQGNLLLDLYRQFQAGEVRLLIAFRHPSTDDPWCLAHLLWRYLPELARQQGVLLQAPVHAHFLYDRGIPLWAGDGVGWLFSRLGGVPVRRGRADRPALRTVRQLLATGRFPVAAAPEGGTNGHNEIVSPLEPGIAQFGFWCVEDLHKQGQSIPVIILPVGLQYRFVGEPWIRLETLLIHLEEICGVAPVKSSGELSIEPLQNIAEDNVFPRTLIEHRLYRRLLHLGDHMLESMESFYRKFYGRDLPPTPKAEAIALSSPPLTPSAYHKVLAQRMQTLLNAALTVSEDAFDVRPQGTLGDRCRRLEQAAWDRIYREDLPPLESLSSLERSLADQVAGEANLLLWHMRLVESFVAVTGQYIAEKPTFSRFADTLLQLWELIARIQGESPFPRPRLAPRRVEIQVGQPINVSEQWDSYRANRRGAIATLTETLQTRLQSLITP